MTVTRTVSKSKIIDWSTIKMKALVLTLVALAMVLGFAIGSIYVQKRFDYLAIQSGHAQHNPINGKIEWTVCK